MILINRPEWQKCGRRRGGGNRAGVKSVANKYCQMRHQPQRNKKFVAEKSRKSAEQFGIAEVR